MANKKTRRGGFPPVAIRLRTVIGENRKIGKSLFLNILNTVRTALKRSKLLIFKGVMALLSSHFVPKTAIIPYDMLLL